LRASEHLATGSYPELFDERILASRQRHRSPFYRQHDEAQSFSEPSRRL
jgi:hypothetical protein